MSDEVMDMDVEGVLPGGLEFSDLPPEIQELILKYLPSKELLDRRFVSRDWRSLCAGLGRKRHFRLLPNWAENPKRSDILTVFKNPNDLPWSCFNVCGLFTGVEPLTEQLLDAFGSQLLVITISGKLNVSTLIRWLRKTTDLRTMNLRLSDGDEPPSTPDDSPQRQLDRVTLGVLKVLDVSAFHKQALRCLESLSAPRLEVLRIWSMDLPDSESAERASTLFSQNIPITSLYLRRDTPPDVLSGLASITRRLRVREVSCCLDKSCLLEHERFLAGLDLGYLEKLQLQIDANVKPGRVMTPFVPDYRAVKELFIFVNYSWSEGPPSSPDLIHSIFFRMETRRFPALRSLRLSTNPEAEPFRVISPSRYAFRTVTELTLEYADNYLDKWNLLFPSIMKLELWVSTPKLRRPYVFAMQRLQYLTVCMYGSLGTGLDDVVVDTMLWLAGIHDPTSLNWESEEAVREYRATHVNPSILQLTGLKEVDMMTINDDATAPLPSPLRDAAVALAFLNMQKLDRLHFSNVPISDECEAKLRTCHGDAVKIEMDLD